MRKNCLKGGSIRCKMCSLAQRVAELRDHVSSIDKDDDRRIPALASAGQKTNIFVGKEQEPIVIELLQLVVKVGKRLGCVNLPKVKQSSPEKTSTLRNDCFTPVDLRCDEEIRLEELTSS